MAHNGNSFIVLLESSFLKIICELSGGSRKKYLGGGAWPLIIWEATTAKRNYYRNS